MSQSRDQAAAGAAGASAAGAAGSAGCSGASAAGSSASAGASDAGSVGSSDASAGSGSGSDAGGAGVCLWSFWVESSNMQNGDRNQQLKQEIWTQSFRKHLRFLNQCWRFVVRFGFGLICSSGL